MDTDDAPPISERRRLVAATWHTMLSDTHMFRPRVAAAALLANCWPRQTMTRLRTALWRFAGVKIASGSLVCGEMTLTGMGDASLLSVGAGCMISGPMHADLGAHVRIGNQVFIGPHATLLTLGHEIGPHERRCGPLAPAPIVIEDGVWIGAHVTVLPGVTIGAGAVIGAGALVTRDIPADTVAVGVPANPVRRIDGQKLRSIRPAPPAFDL